MNFSRQKGPEGTYETSPEEATKTGVPGHELTEMLQVLAPCSE